MQIALIGNKSTKRYSAGTVGAKAANLARMAALGIRVPPAFVLPIELCAAVIEDDPHAAQALINGLREGIAYLENATGKRFGDRRHPLLVSVRSGAARSMPGMLDTVLDLGCTAATVHGLIRVTGHPRFAWDCRRRFLESYGSVVLGINPALFAAERHGLIAAEGVENEQALDGEAIERLAVRYQQLLEDRDCAISDVPMEQLRNAAQAVYRSWTSERATTYRRLEGLEDLRGTAVTVQAMVFGNLGLSSGAGVAFSRDPSTGTAEPVVDVLFESQGEDVVSGTCNPETEEAIVRSVPAAAPQLRETLSQLEREFADVQDVEFTIEEGQLWILQTRSAKRTPLAALQFAIAFVKEGLITPAEGLRRLEGVDLTSLTRKRLAGVPEVAAYGTSASAGIAVGRAVFDSKSAGTLAAGGDPVILVRPDISTTDVAGFAVSTGIVTAVGGRTAHAALVARQMGKPCIVGATALAVNAASHSAQLDGTMIKEGDWLSIDGEKGAIYLARCEVAVQRPEAELAEVARWRTKSLAH